MKDDVDWKKLFIALMDGCLRNESTWPNLSNIHEEEWVKYKKLTKKELEEVEKIADERHDIYWNHFDKRWKEEE